MTVMQKKPKNKPLTSRFQRHTSILIWKSFLQRQRRWRLLLFETVFATVLFILAVYIAKPVFLTPLEVQPEPPLTSADLMSSLDKDNIVGYAPDEPPYSAIMTRAAELLQISVMHGDTEYDLNNNLFKWANASGQPIGRPVIWVLWNPMEGNSWKFHIRSTERARYETSKHTTEYRNPHLRAGFLAVQVAISRAILEHNTKSNAEYEIKLVAMPVSPLMQKERVKRSLSGILLCFTLALIPPVLETQALVVRETVNKFKRGLRMRGVEFSSMYISWLMYAYLTALPTCVMAAIALLLIFRWIHLMLGLLVLLGYVTVMNMTALIMAMFHSKRWIAAIWSTLFTLLQTYLAELIVHHEYDMIHQALTFFMLVLLPPLGLVNAMNEFALLQTGQSNEAQSLWYSLGSWLTLILLYFTILMLLQRTIGHERAIGGQVSWKSIIFKKIEDVNALHRIENPTGRERENLQEVDEFVAKAVSFHSVSKSIMGVKVLHKLTLDIYRGEFTMLFTERVQEKLVITVEDLLTGLAFADSGSINVLGHIMRPGKNYMTQPHMLGYCHLPNFLIPDLTVMEHFNLFNEICMWRETRQYIWQYGSLRVMRLLEECNLEKVQNELVRELDVYYRAQLCWALAQLLEPRVIIMPSLSDQHPRYSSVIVDKIMQYRTYLTIIKTCFSSLQLEYADRVFVFDSKIIAFGGTPAYMFFKYGREYRVRMTIRSDGSLDDESIKDLLQRAADAGASVRAHLGSLLILRLPANPTEVVADLVKDLVENSNRYGMMSIHISVPDSEEVYRRAMMESRSTNNEATATYEAAKNALKRIAEPQEWERKVTVFSNITHLRNIGWKYFCFHIHYRLYLIITLLSAIVAGIFIGLSLSSMLIASDRNEATKAFMHGGLLTMEATGEETTLVLRSDFSSISTSIANAYTLSEYNASEAEVNRLTYTALSHTESLTEYLVTRAIDSPKIYVSMFAYGMDVTTDYQKVPTVQVLYSPLHKDYSAAARSLAKAHTALLRHFTNKLNASIQVIDEPLALDLTPWMGLASMPPLFLQFLLILCISHITLIPSMENGLIKHMQSHAMNFSPARYWLTLYFCDLILYWVLVALMSGLMVLIFFLVVPAEHFQYEDLAVVPFMLILYGFACVPQAYLFSLGPRVALNTMTFVIVNIVFGETTIIAKIFYGETLNYALLLMNLSPQFNMAYSFVKIKQIFLYNSECIIFRTQNLCSGKILHKCCKKCGVLQECFRKKNYLSNPGIIREVIAMVTISILFMAILLLLEYKVIRRLWKYFTSELKTEEKKSTEKRQPGVERENEDVMDKWDQIKQKQYDRFDTFGEYLIAKNLTLKQQGVFVVHNVCFGLGKGEALALSGLKRHGRLKLVEMLAGITQPDQGCAFSMSRWNMLTEPHMYARQISVSCNHEPLPPWMSVYDALELLALLRGVPKKYVKAELRNIIEALEIQEQADVLVCRITQKTDRTRLRFAAAIVGAPPIIVLDECTAHQKSTVRRSMYCILHILRKRGHAIFISSSSVESHMPMTNRLAIMVDGTIYDIDTVDNWVERYSNKGYTVVLHLKDEVNVRAIFARHFKNFTINDNSEVLVNVQILDRDLNWATIFEKMEALKTENQQVYSYIITAIPIDYIYNSIINSEKGNKPVTDIFKGHRKIIRVPRSKIQPSKERLASLLPFRKKYDIMKLRELPWSVIFHT